MSYTKEINVLGEEYTISEIEWDEFLKRSKEFLPGYDERYTEAVAFSCGKDTVLCDLDTHPFWKDEGALRRIKKRRESIRQFVICSFMEEYGISFRRPNRFGDVESCAKSMYSDFLRLFEMYGEKIVKACIECGGIDLE